MICLTGDVHHITLNSETQSLLGVDESILAEKYAAIADNFNVKITLFITGKAFKDEWQTLKPLKKFKNLEIGGHTYSAFQPKLLHALFKRTTGSYYGPYIYQKKDILKTISEIKKKTGRKILTWRTHSYLSTSTTYDVLDNLGFKIVTDEVHLTESYPKTITGELISLPINVPPDHEYIYHGSMTKDVVNEMQKRGVINHKMYTVEEWLSLVKQYIYKIEKNNGIATILAHPSTMELCDKMETLKKLCKYISKHDNIFVSQVDNLV